MPDGAERPFRDKERQDISNLPVGDRLFHDDDNTSQRPERNLFTVFGDPHITITETDGARIVVKAIGDHGDELLQTFDAV